MAVDSRLRWLLHAAQKETPKQMKQIISFADLRHSMGHDEFYVYPSLTSNFAMGRGGLDKNYRFGKAPKTLQDFQSLIYVGGQSLN
jgi:hypothetical protein